MNRAAVLCAFCVWLCSAAAAQARPYVTVQDDGRFQGINLSSNITLAQINDIITSLYAKSGAPLPQILSIWSAFDFDGNFVETITLPESNDVTGIGFDKLYGGDGTFSSPVPPIETVLIHNNVLRMSDRAAHQRAPLAGYATYLFLLEVTHKWGPAIVLSGSTPGDLIGFTFHWSFWFNSGGSPVGGNQWVDNGDGGFSTVVRTPSQVQYSPLDLYVMGLADSTTVAPFNVLQSPVVPTHPTDPIWGGVFSAKSFPDFDSTPLTVTATSKSYTIDDVIAGSGTRNPSAATAPKNWTLGIMLIVPQDAGVAEIATAQAAFDPMAETFAPAFATATGGLGSLTVITGDMDGGVDAGTDGGVVDSGVVDAGDSDAGADSGVPLADAGSPDAGTVAPGDDGDGGGPVPDAGVTTPVGSHGCSSGGPLSPLGALVLLLLLRIRRRAVACAGSPPG
jgi:hypothetical protein